MAQQEPRLCLLAPVPEENDGNGTEQVGCRQSRKGHKVLMKKFGHYLIEKRGLSYFWNWYHQVTSDSCSSIWNYICSIFLSPMLN